jgi:hypothetical protein
MPVFIGDYRCFPALHERYKALHERYVNVKVKTPKSQAGANGEIFDRVMKAEGFRALRWVAAASESGCSGQSGEVSGGYYRSREAHKDGYKAQTGSFQEPSRKP